MKNLRRLACKFDLDQSECKSSQVNTSLLATPFGQGLMLKSFLVVSCVSLVFIAQCNLFFKQQLRRELLKSFLLALKNLQ